MDRNTFTGLFLILVILVGSTFLLKPSEEEVKREQAVQDSIAHAKAHPDAPKKAAPQATAAATIADTTVSTATKESITTLENDKLKLSVSTLGGKIVSAELKGETNYTETKPVVLFNGQNNYGLEFAANTGNVITNNSFFTPVSSQPNQLTMRLSNPDGSSIDYVYTLSNGSNKVKFDIILNGFQNKIAPSTSGLVFNWAAELQKQEKDLKSERLYSTTYYKIKDGDVDYLSTANTDDKVFEDEMLEWVSFKQHFFSAVLISEAGFAKTSEVKVATLDNSELVKAYQAKLILPYKSQPTSSYSMEFYFGNNKFSQLKDQGHDLEKQVKMGWGPLKWINRYLVLPIFNFFETFNMSYGLIILLLTIILKTVLFPFTYKSYLSMAKMRVLKPEMDEIKKRVGEDNQALVQQEYLKLYRQAGVNPLGGCLPLLFQMPFILAFFYFFPNLFELRHESFLWMHDLSTYDELISFAPIPVLGWNHISAMCLLMTVSTLVYTYFNNQVSGAQGQMKYISYVMPIIFFGVLNDYPAGLNYYYFCANILTFSQQYFIRKFVDDDKIHAQIQQNKQKPESSKKKGGFQKRLEDMMRQQQQAQAQQKNKQK